MSKKLSNAKKHKMIADLVTTDFVSCEGIKVKFKGLTDIPVLKEINISQMLSPALTLSIREYIAASHVLSLVHPSQLFNKTIEVSFIQTNQEHYVLSARPSQLSNETIEVNFTQTNQEYSVQRICNISINDHVTPLFGNSSLNPNEIDITFVLNSICIDIFFGLGIADAITIDIIAHAVESTLANIFKSSRKKTKDLRLDTNINEFKQDNLLIKLENRHDVIANLRFNPVLVLAAMLIKYKSNYQVTYSGQIVITNAIRNLIPEGCSKDQAVTRIYWRNTLETSNDVQYIDIIDTDDIESAINDFLYKFGVWHLKDSSGQYIFYDSRRLEVISDTTETSLSSYIDNLSRFIRIYNLKS